MLRKLLQDPPLHFFPAPFFCHNPFYLPVNFHQTLFIFVVAAILIYGMSDTIPDALYLEEEEGKSNHPRSFQLKTCTLHLLLCTDFNREPGEVFKLIKKILKVSTFLGEPA